MPITPESWQPIADTLGFRNEGEMLMNLYLQQEFSLREMGLILGYSSISIRRRLIMLGVPMRLRGGAANRIGRRLLKMVSNEELFDGKPDELAAKHGVHVVTVFAEKRLRKGEKKDGILPDRTDQLHEAVRTEEPHPHGAGTVVAEE